MRHLAGWWLLSLAVMAGCQSGGATGARNEDDRLKLAEINTQIAIAYMRDGDNEAALRKLESAVDANPKSVNAHNAMALLFSRLGETKEAEKSYQKALALEPRNLTALNNYGLFLCQQKRYADGLVRFREAYENPLNGAPENALANAGTCALQSGETTQAEDYFRQALQRSPTLPPALLAMADLSADRADYLGARDYYQRYLNGSPQSPRTLLLGVRIEHALDNQDAVASYALQMKNRFPDSPEYGRFLRGEFE